MLAPLLLREVSDREGAEGERLCLEEALECSEAASRPGSDSLLGEASDDDEPRGLSVDIFEGIFERMEPRKERVEPWVSDFEKEG